MAEASAQCHVSASLDSFTSSSHNNHCMAIAPFPCDSCGDINQFTKQPRLLTPLRKRPFENIVGKGENAGNQHFLLFPQCFLLCERDESSYL